MHGTVRRFLKWGFERSLISRVVLQNASPEALLEMGSPASVSAACLLLSIFHWCRLSCAVELGLSCASAPRNLGIGVKDASTNRTGSTMTLNSMDAAVV